MLINVFSNMYISFNKLYNFEYEHSIGTTILLMLQYILAHLNILE